MYAKFRFQRPNFRVFGQILGPRPTLKFWGGICILGFFLIFVQILEFEEKSQILDFAQFWISGQILEF